MAAGSKGSGSKGRRDDREMDDMNLMYEKAPPKSPSKLTELDSTPGATRKFDTLYPNSRQTAGHKDSLKSGNSAGAGGDRGGRGDVGGADREESGSREGNARDARDTRGHEAKANRAAAGAPDEEKNGNGRARNRRADHAGAASGPNGNADKADKARPTGRPPGDAESADSMMGLPDDPNRPSSYLALAVLAAIFCNIAFGAVAVWSAFQSGWAADERNYERAREKGKHALIFSVVGIIVTIVIVLIVVIYFVAVINGVGVDKATDDLSSLSKTTMSSKDRFLRPLKEWDVLKVFEYWMYLEHSTLWHEGNSFVLPIAAEAAGSRVHLHTEDQQEAANDTLQLLADISGEARCLAATKYINNTDWQNFVKFVRQQVGNAAAQSDAIADQDDCSEEQSGQSEPSDSDSSPGHNSTVADLAALASQHGQMFDEFNVTTPRLSH